MKILTYDMLNQNDYTKYINSEIVDKLIYNNLHYYNTQKNIYFLLLIPILQYNYTKTKNSPYELYEEGYMSSMINIPTMIFKKIIICYNIKFKKFIFIVNDMNDITDKNILNFLINNTNYIIKINNIFDNLIMKINKILINIDYFKLTKMINLIDKLLIYLHYFNSIYMQINNIFLLINNKHELLYILKNNLNNINNNILTMKENLQNIRQTLFQKITYIETGNSRILTGVATIFLPLSFIIAFFSLPFKNMPLRKNKYGYIYIIMLIIISLCIIYYGVYNLNLLQKTSIVLIDPEITYKTS